jgi:hypothetical protein
MAIIARWRIPPGVFPDALFRLWNTNKLQHLYGLLQCRLSRHSLMKDKRFADLSTDCHHWVQGCHRLLEDHRNMISADVAQRGPLKTEQIDAIETN